LIFGPAFCWSLLEFEAGIYSPFKAGRANHANCH